jgi:capsular polysaccharide biosynthesis protein
VTLNEFGWAARRHWFTFVVVAAVTFALGFAAVLLMPKQYVSSARLMVSISGTTTASAYQNEEVATRRVLSYIPLITSGVVMQRVIDKLGLPLTTSQLADEIDVANVPPKTPLIDIEVTDPSPDRAQEIANPLADEFIVYATAIETPTGEDSQKIHTTVVTRATPGRENPLIPVFLGILAAVVSLLMGAVAVWVRAVRSRGDDAGGEDAAGDDVADKDTAGDSEQPDGVALETTVEPAREPVAANQPN